MSCPSGKIRHGLPVEVRTPSSSKRTWLRSVGSSCPYGQSRWSRYEVTILAMTLLSAKFTPPERYREWRSYRDSNPV